MRRYAMQVVLVALLLCAPVFAGVTSNVTVPFNQVVFIPCANGGTGEAVTLSGDLHVVTTVTVNDNTLHMTQHFQPQGVKGVGSVTGDKYQATGVTRQDTNVNGEVFPYNTTFVNNFRIIGQGPGNNFLVHATVHTTVNANGDVTAEVSNMSEECR